MLTNLETASHWLIGQIAGIHVFTLMGGIDDRHGGCTSVLRHRKNCRRKWYFFHWAE